MYEDSYRHKGLRRRLIEQLRNKGISDERVLEAMMSVPRHWFLDSAFLEHAYQDKAFPIEEGQTISQPYTVAYQTQLLDVKAHHKILEIGTGSGYQAAVLASMGARVYTVEYHRRLYQKAKQTFARIGISMRIHAFCGDGSQGLAAYAPFDRILITAATPSIPPALYQQLAIGGYLVAPVGGRHQQQMLRVRKEDETSFSKEAFDFFKFVPLLGKHGWQK